MSLAWSFSPQSLFYRLLGIRELLSLHLTCFPPDSAFVHETTLLCLHLILPPSTSTLRLHYTWSPFPGSFLTCGIQIWLGSSEGIQDNLKNENLFMPLIRDGLQAGMCRQLTLSELIFFSSHLCQETWAKVWHMLSFKKKQFLKNVFSFIFCSRI